MYTESWIKFKGSLSVVATKTTQLLQNLITWRQRRGDTGVICPLFAVHVKPHVYLRVDAWREEVKAQIFSCRVVAVDCEAPSVDPYMCTLRPIPVSYAPSTPAAETLVELPVKSFLRVLATPQEARWIACKYFSNMAKYAEVYASGDIGDLHATSTWFFGQSRRGLSNTVGKCPAYGTVILKTPFTPQSNPMRPRVFGNTSRAEIVGVRVHLSGGKWMGGPKGCWMVGKPYVPAKPEGRYTGPPHLSKCYDDADCVRQFHPFVPVPDAPCSDGRLDLVIGTYSHVQSGSIMDARTKVRNIKFTDEPYNFPENFQEWGRLRCLCALEAKLTLYHAQEGKLDQVPALVQVFCDLVPELADHARQLMRTFNPVYA